jgi:hypothetical protein
MIGDTPIINYRHPVDINIMIIISFISTVISFLTSGMLCGEVGAKEKRGLWPYFVLGLFLGPLALLLFLAPARKENTPPPIARRPLRVLRGAPCSACGREIPVRSCSCPNCGGSTSVPLWESVDL